MEADLGNGKEADDLAALHDCLLPMPTRKPVGVYLPTLCLVRKAN